MRGTFEIILLTILLGVFKCPKVHDSVSSPVACHTHFSFISCSFATDGTYSFSLYHASDSSLLLFDKEI